MTNRLRRVTIPGSRSTAKRMSVGDRSNWVGVTARMSERVQQQARDRRDGAREREENARERAARNRERGEELLARRQCSWDGCRRSIWSIGSTPVGNGLLPLSQKWCRVDLSRGGVATLPSADR
jgi:hypothetical protein